MYNESLLNATIYILVSEIYDVKTDAANVAID